MLRISARKRGVRTAAAAHLSSYQAALVNQDEQQWLALQILERSHSHVSVLALGAPLIFGMSQLSNGRLVALARLLIASKLAALPALLHHILATDVAQAVRVVWGRLGRAALKLLKPADGNILCLWRTISHKRRRVLRHRTSMTKMRQLTTVRAHQAEFGAKVSNDIKAAVEAEPLSSPSEELEDLVSRLGGTNPNDLRAV